VALFNTAGQYERVDAARICAAGVQRRRAAAPWPAVHSGDDQAADGRRLSGVPAATGLNTVACMRWRTAPARRCNRSRAYLTRW